MGRTVWKNDFVFDAYELAKSGMTEKKIAKTLGISFGTFTLWEKKNPFVKQIRNVFGTGIKRGRQLAKKKDGSTFSLRDFIAGRLPEDLRELWHKINRCDSLKNGTERLEAILSGRGVRIRHE